MIKPEFTQKVIPQVLKQKKRLHILVAIFVFLLGIIVIGAVSIYVFEKKYQNKIYYGIKLGNKSVSGLTEDELRNLIIQYRTDLETNGIIFTYKDKQVTVFPHITAADDPDLIYELFYVNVEGTVKKIFSIGRTSNFWEDFKTKKQLIKKPQSLFLDIQIFDDKLLNTLQESFRDLEIPAKNAELKIDTTLDVTIIPEEEGAVPDYNNAIEELKRNVQNVSKNEIVLLTKKDFPKIKAQNLQEKKKEIEAIFVNREMLILKHNKEVWDIGKDIYKNWLVTMDKKLVFNEGPSDYIKKQIAPKVEIPVEEARFVRTENGKVKEFKPSKDGLALDYEQTLQEINNSFFDLTKENTSVTLVTKIIKPQYSTESVNNMGIKELIGKGVSNFSGSPTNRRHNIKVGADTLNGVLIPPGEEFSLVKTLGSVNAEAGYLPELVIKGNRTIPEYGGGLCQIGTTLFRAALDSGLPITERRSHSYRVRYYEPAGVDCTIYDPHPDCRFVNDTGSHVLIQTYMTEKDDLVFEFWGTKDGRNVVKTKPVLYNITKPAPTKYIETEDLPPGEVKCIERSHDGAEATFNYTVTYSDGTKKEQTFNSYYRPWQAVCLVGKAKDDTKTEKQGTD